MDKEEIINALQREDILESIANAIMDNEDEIMSDDDLEDRIGNADADDVLDMVETQHSETEILEWVNNKISTEDIMEAIDDQHSRKDIVKWVSENLELKEVIPQFEKSEVEEYVRENKEIFLKILGYNIDHNFAPGEDKTGY